MTGENGLQIFDDSRFGRIRTTVIDNQPWFVGKDVAAALGYKEPTKAAREKVDAEDRRVSEIDTPSGIQVMTIINESGLYSLILTSKLPAAKEFKRWVTSEVLPMIRKTGIYSLCADDESTAAPMRTLTPDDYLAAARLIASCKSDRLRIVLSLLAKGGWDVEEAQTRLITGVDTSDIRERLCRVKEQRGMTWQQLSEELSMDSGVLRMYGSGRRFPRPERYEAMVRALDALEYKEVEEP